MQLLKDLYWNQYYWYLQGSDYHENCWRDVAVCADCTKAT